MEFSYTLHRDMIIQYYEKRLKNAKINLEYAVSKNQSQNVAELVRKISILEHTISCLKEAPLNED